MDLTPRAPDGTYSFPDLPLRVGGRSPTVVVVGDSILDGWLSGVCRGVCREAPAPVVRVARRHYAPGGAANTAANLAALGVDVALLSAVGDDEDGAALRAALRECGVDDSHLVVDAGMETAAKRRIVSGDQVIARLDTGSVRGLGSVAERRLGRALGSALAGADAVLVDDYGLGSCGRVVRERLRYERDRIRTLVVDSHDLAGWRETQPDVVTPNADEAAALVGADLSAATDRSARIERQREGLREATGAAAVVVTLDRDGSVLLDGSLPPHRTWTTPVADNRTAGAGDTFVAALTAGITVDLPLAASVELAQAAADVVVQDPGTSVCDALALSRRLAGARRAAVGADRLAGLVEQHRRSGRRIVFTNGCFDVLHSGHVAYLNQAKRLGDVLIVAVNSDRSVTRLKGDGRPVNAVADRAAVLAALSCVDHVVVFAEDTPRALLDRLRPDVYAKGGDYTVDTLPEAETVRRYGGEIALLDFVPDRSTSRLIDRIRTGAAAS